MKCNIIKYLILKFMSAIDEVENIYDEVEIDDMDFEDDRFYYPCPCGDKF